MPTRTRTEKPPRFTVEAGRQIYMDGAPFIGVSREGLTNPADADAVTHQIAAFLNEHGAKGWRGRKL